METSSSSSVSTRLERIAKLAREAPGMAFTTLAHHIDIALLAEAFRRTRKDGAPGVDGQTAEQYAARLEENLQRLLQRLKSNTYRAPPVRRVHIRKGKGPETRPIGIPTLEDKLLQRAVLSITEAIYEQDFLPCSFGFRPGRSAHQALEALRNGMMEMNGGWVLEVDIRKFFDTLDHRHLREILGQRVRDGAMLRLIGKWLNAGVLENGTLSYPDAGTPQGGVISPLLANIYLHAVIDQWFERTIQPRLHGRAFLIRYADDLVMVFACEADARWVQASLSARLAQYGLTLHPTKTRLLPFRRPPYGELRRTGDRPGTFEFLGFTHHWARSRRGNWVIKRRTAAKRFGQALRRIHEWCRLHRHQKVGAQARTLALKLRGHYAYYGITGNSVALDRFRDAVCRIWKRWLSRRSQRGWVSWPRFRVILARYPLPPPRAVHSTLAYAANP